MHGHLDWRHSRESRHGVARRPCAEAFLPPGRGSVAIGRGSSAEQDGAIAIGNGVRTQQPNEIRIGTDRQSLTIPSLGLGATPDAKVGSNRFVAADPAGSLSPSAFTVDDLTGRIGNVGRRAAEGTAVALAVGGLAFPPEGRSFALSGNLASYEGQTAGGVALVGRLAHEEEYDVYLNGGLGVGLDFGLTGLKTKPFAVTTWEKSATDYEGCIDTA